MGRSCESETVPFAVEGLIRRSRLHCADDLPESSLLRRLLFCEEISDDNPDDPVMLAEWTYTPYVFAKTRQITEHIYGNLWTSGAFQVYTINESRHSNVGEHFITVYSESDLQISVFLEDIMPILLEDECPRMVHGVLPRIETQYSCMQWG